MAARRSLLLAPLSLLSLWLPIIYLLGAQWSIYEQYHYGWAVPVLCLYLLWKRWRSTPSQPFGPGSQLRAPSSLLSGPLLLAPCLLLLPTRILQEANPLWRFASYALAGEAIVITLSSGRSKPATCGHFKTGQSEAGGS